MNKSALIEILQKDAKLETKAEATRQLDNVLAAIKKGLKKDKNVQLVGFGTFSVRHRKARTGRNPHTGEQIKIKASKTVGFKPGKAFKESI